MDLDFSKMSSTTIFSIALLAALVILLIVLVIVTIKVLSKGKKEEKEYMERRYTTRESKKKDGEDREDQEDQEDQEDGEAEEEKKDKKEKRKKKDSKDSKDSSDKASEASKDSKDSKDSIEDEEDDEDEDEDDEDENEESEESDEDEDKPEVKDEVAAVVEAALQAKAKAAELEARVAKEKAERAAEEAAIAAEKASQAEAEAQAATKKVTPISMQDRLRKKQEEEIPVEVTEPTEKMPALDEELSEAQENVKDTAEVADVAEEDFDDEDYDDEVTEDTDEIPVARINRELKKQAAEQQAAETEDKQVDPDVLKATTKVADAQEIISAVKKAKAKGRKPEEGDSAFGENAFPVDGEVKDESKKKLETSFDSAFTDVQLHQEIEGRKDELTDSAFGVQEPIQEEEIKPLQVASETITVNPVNAVNIPTVNAVAPVETKNPEAGIESATDMKEFLTENPVPKKSKKKIKKKDAAFAKKFDSDAPKLKTAEYFWYNNQDIEALTKKEDMYFYCHYFHDPAKAVLPLIIEMYDCAFVRTEELQKIAYGIQYKSMGLREILTAKDNVSFDRSRITKEPTDKDMLQIRAKWCDYVDKFLQIIVIQAPEDVQEYLRNQLYSYGENDVDTLLFCPEPEDEEE